MLDIVDPRRIAVLQFSGLIPQAGCDCTIRPATQAPVFHRSPTESLRARWDRAVFEQQGDSLSGCAGHQAFGLRVRASGPAFRKDEEDMAAAIDRSLHLRGHICTGLKAPVVDQHSQANRV